MQPPPETEVRVIPTRFTWPYGGRNVYIVGTFTGWTQFPMIPVEGCPTVFQGVCNVPEGYNEYKFYVDGEFRHDQHQQFTNSKCGYGIVNIIILAEHPPPPPMPTTQIANTSMDVDNDAFQRLVTVSGGGISEADIALTRHRISEFMSGQTAYELLPHSGKVVALDVDLPVKQAFHILHEQGIPMAPLWDFCRGKCVGILTALDFILIMKELGNHGSNLTEEELETHTISAWKEAKAYVNRQGNDPARTGPRQLIHAGPDDSMKDVALKLIQTRVATIPIIHSSSEEGTYPQLLHLASLSDILKSICRYFRYSLGSLPALQLPVEAIKLGTWVPEIGDSTRRPVAMLRPSASLNAALNLLVYAQVSSILIVDDNDSLLDVYSRSDITALAKDKLYARINLEETTIHQALQLSEEPYSPYGITQQRCHMCLPSDPVHKIMERLCKPGVRRVIIVEAGSKRVLGIITLSDIFRFLLG